MRESLKISNQELAKQLPDLITKGVGTVKAATLLGIGVPRLRRLASDEQLKQLAQNGQNNVKKLQKEEVIKQVQADIERAIENGWGINKTVANTDLSHFRLHRYASDEQIKKLKENGQRHGDIARQKEAPAPQGIRHIKDQAIAKQRMQEIIAGRHYA